MFTLYKKADRKPSALSRISNYTSFEKKRIYSKAFEESQFEYCSLTWMFYNRKTNSKINLIYGRSLRIVRKGNITTSKELPKNDREIFSH